jgi:hypothetical protein
VGDGFVALWGDGDLIVTEQGRHARQELRSRGAGQVWLCSVGEGGSFGDFIQRMKQPVLEGLGLRWLSPQGEEIAFHWDDAPLPDANFPHYQNAYTDTPLDSAAMTILYGDESLILGLE